VTVGPENFVTGQVESAIPSVAVASNGIVGFFYTFDGTSPPPDNIPIFFGTLGTEQRSGRHFSAIRCCDLPILRHGQR